MPTNSTPERGIKWPCGNSRMAQQVRHFDWSATPLGPVETWSSHLRFALSMVLDSSSPTALVWGADRTTFHNDAFQSILGDEAILRRPFGEVCGDAWPELEDIVEQALAGRASVHEDRPVTVQRSGARELAYFMFSFSPLRGADGDVYGFLSVATETTQKVLTTQALEKAQERQRLLLEELQHRVRDNLGTIRAIVRRSAAGSVSVEELGMHLEGRIAAFARTQAAATRDPETHLALETIVSDTLLLSTAREGDSYSIAGPVVHLAPKASELLGLAIHELMTNAVKFGALSEPQGFITVNWTKEADEDGDPILHFRWAETGMQLPMPEPDKIGFGTEFLTRTLADELDAVVERHYAAAGMSYSIRIPETERLIAAVSSQMA